MQPTEHRAPVDEQTSLFYRAWLPPNARKAVVMVHRGHEHSGRLVDVVEELALTETAVFAWDARGHGKSPGERGYAPSFSRVVKDLDVFVRYVSQQHGIAIEDIAIGGGFLPSPLRPSRRGSSSASGCKSQSRRVAESQSLRGVRSVPL